MRFREIFEGQNTTPFTCLQAVTDIVGKENISLDRNSIKPNQFLITSVDLDDKYNQIDKKDASRMYPHQLAGKNKAIAFAAFSRRTDADNAPSPFFKDMPELDEKPFSGTITVPDINSRDAAHIASAVHEAYHAWIFSRSKAGNLYANEKMVNQLAEKWLKKHLSGIQLHAALEVITHSRISYGHNEE